MAALGAAPGKVYFYTSSQGANSYCLGGQTLTPFRWTGFHNMARGTPYKFGGWAAYYGTQIMGSREMIFGDSHSEMMSWKEMCCRAAPPGGDGGWLTSACEPSSSYGPGIGEAAGFDYASCTKTAGEQ